MAGQKKLGIMSKHGDRIKKAQVAHQKDAVDWGFRPLPAGVKGVARLTKCGFHIRDQEPNKGEIEWSASGSVVESEPHGFEGATTFCGPQFYGLFDQKDDKGNIRVDNRGMTQDFDYQLNRIMNEMFKIGGETFAAKHKLTDPEDIAAMLIKAPNAYFRFETKEGKIQIDPKTKKPKVDPKTGEPYKPRVNHNWYGCQGLDGYVPPAKNGKAAVQDNTQTTEDGVVDETGHDTSDDDAIAQNQADAATGGDNLDESDLDAIAVIADDEKHADYEAAGEKLIEIALGLGLSEKLVKKDTKTWTALVALIRKTQAAQEAEAAAEETTTEEEGGEEVEVETEAETEEPAVKVGAVMNYHLVRKNDKGKFVKDKKATSAEVLEIDEEKQVARIKNLVDGRTVYKNVKWSDLTPDA